MAHCVHSDNAAFKSKAETRETERLKDGEETSLKSLSRRYVDLIVLTLTLSKWLLMVPFRQRACCCNYYYCYYYYYSVLHRFAVNIHICAAALSDQTSLIPSTHLLMNTTTDGFLSANHFKQM